MLVLLLLLLLLQRALLAQGTVLVDLLTQTCWFDWCRVGTGCALERCCLNWQKHGFGEQGLSGAGVAAQKHAAACASGYLQRLLLVHLPAC
jgi:hypothetical protein